MLLVAVGLFNRNEHWTEGNKGNCWRICILRFQIGSWNYGVGSAEL